MLVIPYRIDLIEGAKFIVDDNRAFAFRPKPDQH